jgi:SAM-dependent methyltransferase
VANRNRRPADERVENDAYETPAPLALAICRRIAEMIEPPRRVIDAGAGTGIFCAAARLTWPGAQIAAVDLDPGHEAICRLRGAANFHAGDFLALAPEVIGRADLVLGNPPYSLAEEFIRHAWMAFLDRDAPARWLGSICFLLRGGFRAGAGRWGNGGLFDLAPPRASWPVVPRPSFSGDGKTEGTEYEIMLWTVGHAGGVTPLRWERAAKLSVSETPEVQPQKEEDHDQTGPEGA